jgi:hypothetical protein
MLTYGLRTTKDLHAKLLRDAGALEAEVTSDRMFNFVVTGYSLIDWAKQDPSLPEGARKAANNGSLHTSHWLRVCGDLATASKHFHVTRRQPITDAATSRQGWGAGRWGHGAFGRGEEAIEIRLNDGTSFGIIDLVQGVLAAWSDFFREHGISVVDQHSMGEDKA